MLETINEAYTGDCKKGKAQSSEGTAKGADSYKGQFKKGFVKLTSF